jgi:biotin synthase-like enzyme
MDIIEKANNVYRENFEDSTFFGRCIFLSWYCDLGTCKFCFRSTIKHKIAHSRNAKRSMASILTDAVIGKNLGWPIEFVTGGYRIFPFDEIVEIVKHVSKIYGEKIWVNLGAMTEEELLKLKPHVEGVCASIETIEPQLHKQVCPDKPVEPYSEMMETAGKLGFKKAITIVIGLGEKKEDFEILKEYIEKNKLDRITFYALKPVQGTEFTKSPEAEYYAWWIAKTRTAFPKLKIMAGLTPRKVDYVSLILKAGANGITKFPALKQFNSEKAQLVENLAKKERKKFFGSLTKMPNIDWDEEVDKLDLNSERKEKVKRKIKQYLNAMNKQS